MKKISSLFRSKSYEQERCLAAFDKGDLNKANGHSVEAIEEFERCIRHGERAIEQNSVKQIVVTALLELGKLQIEAKYLSKAQSCFERAQKLGCRQAAELLQDLVRQHGDVILAGGQISWSAAVNTATPPIMLSNPTAVAQHSLFSPFCETREVTDTAHLCSMLKCPHLTNGERSECTKTALSVIEAFSSRTVLTADILAEVHALSTCAAEVVVRALISALLSALRKSELVNPALMYTLSDVIRTADARWLRQDDLYMILLTLREQYTKHFHGQPCADDVLVFLTGLCGVLTAMEDANVKGMDRVALHEPLHDLLTSIVTAQHSGTSTFLALYARQALVRIRHSESRLLEAVRRTALVADGLNSLRACVVNYDPFQLIAAYKSIAAAATFQAGQEVWYDDLRTAELLLMCGQWVGFNLLVGTCASKDNAYFLTGAVRALDGEVCNRPSAEADQLVTFLNHLLCDYKQYGAHEKVRVAVAHVLRKLAVEQPPPLSDRAATLLAGFRATVGEQAWILQFEGNIKPANGSSLHSPQAGYKPAALSTELLDKARTSHHVAVMDNFTVLKQDLSLLVNQTSTSAERVSTSIKTKWAALRQAELAHIADLRVLDTYIDVLGGAGSVESMYNLFALRTRVMQYVQDATQRVLLLVGRPGGGKSTFILRLLQELWQLNDLSDPTAIIPVLINLPHVAAPQENILETYLESLGFTSAQVEHMRTSGHRFLILLDGYDEMRTECEFNLYTSNRLHRWSAQVVVTCRTSYKEDRLRGAYAQYFAPHNDLQVPDYAALAELFVAPFTERQVEAYIEKYLSAPSTDLRALPEDWRTKVPYLAHIAQQGMGVLLQTPFLLYVAVVAMPHIATRPVDDSAGHTMPASTHTDAYSSRVRMTKKMLLDRFVQHLFERERTKLLLANQLPSGRDVCQDFWEFATDLAAAMLKAHVQIAFYEPASQLFRSAAPRSTATAGGGVGNPWAKFFGSTDKNVERARLGCMCLLHVHKKHSYAFMHSLLLDYFGAKALERQICENHGIIEDSPISFF